MLKILGRISSIVGAVLLSSILVISLGVAARLIQVRFFREPVAPEYLEAKLEYLERVEQTTTATSQNSPNIVIILFDDLGYGDLSSYGNQLIETPNIDALAERGIRMTNFYSAAPICTPSRAALLTGRFPFRSGAANLVFFPNDSPVGTAIQFMGKQNEIHRDEIFLPEALRAAGYATGMVGKWHLGDADGHRPNDLGFDEWYGALWSNDMQPFHIYRNGEIEIRNEMEMNFQHSFRDEEDTRPQKGLDQRTITDDYTREAIAFIEQTQESGPNPFFLYLAHTAPHVPHFPSAVHAGESRGGTYGDVVEDLDRSTGEIIEALDHLGVADNTLVFVTSDNGADYGGSVGGLRGRKTQILEGGQRVPMIAVLPGQIPAGISPEIAMNTDLFPTILGLANVPLPTDREIDGEDLTPLLTAGAESPHDYLYYFNTGVGSAPTVKAVRDREFKYLLQMSDLGRSRAHLSSLTQDHEAHDLRRLYPETEERLASAAANLQAKIDENLRGFFSRPD